MIVINDLTILVALVGTIFIVGGLVLSVFPPRNINMVYGYRTATSMKNINTWKSANRYAAKVMMTVGLMLNMLGVIASFLPDMGNAGVLLGVLLIIVSAIMIVVQTEKHLAKQFDKEGNLRK